MGSEQNAELARLAAEWFAVMFFGPLAFGMAGGGLAWLIVHLLQKRAATRAALPQEDGG
jgi:hypothetical protein